MKVAICYYGLIRGFKYDNVFNSHQEYLYDVLKSQNINFSVFLSTYDKDYDNTNVEKIPNLVKVNKRSDAVITESIKKYSDRFICPINFGNELKMNLLKSWSSQQDLREMILESNDTFDFIIVMDLAQKILTPLDDIRLFDTNAIYVPNFSHHYGYNDRMTIGNTKDILFLMNKLNYLLSQEKIPIMCTREVLKLNRSISPNLHPESAYKIYLENIGNLTVKHFKMKFWRCRTNGDMVKDC